MIEQEPAGRYVHDAHCNVIHVAGPQPCPPHCTHYTHGYGQCRACGSYITPTTEPERTAPAMTSPTPGSLFVSYHLADDGDRTTRDPYKAAQWCHPRAPQAPAVGDLVVSPAGNTFEVVARQWRPLPEPTEYGRDAIRCAIYLDPYPAA
jgi:hypothetical protein